MADVHDQALDNLVNQFARPLDFLRELAQNSIDAGSPRIEVWVDYLPPSERGAGVLQIGVDDFGEGMDEAIIDDKLSRLFESTKDDDLTKIGKFGIGFTSIFAIRPDAVVLLTGRHGTFWKLHFHADRTFSKLAYEEPVHGTRITLYKEMAPDDVDRFVADARDNLAYWCEHSDTPITFHDRRGATAAAPEADAIDPFAAFGDEVEVHGPEPISRPLDLDLPLWVHHREPGTEVVVGYADRPRYGFYNGGLTLLNTPHRDALGPFEPVLGHLAFKVKSDRLEHTLTRDNVLHDQHWAAAMNVVVRAQQALRDALLERTRQAVVEGSPLGPWHRHLAAACRAANGGAFRERLDPQPVLRDADGGAVTLARVRNQERALGAVVLGDGEGPLHEALRGMGLTVLADDPATRDLLEAAEEPPLFGFLASDRRLARASEVFVLPEVIDDSHLSVEERTLLERTRDLLAAAVGLHVHVPVTEQVLRLAPSPEGRLNRLDLAVGDFGGLQLGPRDVLALNGPRDRTVFVRPTDRWLSLPGFLQWRTLLLNRHHPLFRAQVLAAHEDLDLAAVGLASALLDSEGLESEATHRRLIDAAWTALEPRA